MTLASLVSSLRALAADGPDSKVVLGETLGSAQGLNIDGSNKYFRLTQIPVVEGSVYVTITGSGSGNGFRLQTGFALSDPQNGILIFDTAPAAGKTISVDYNYYYMNDDSMIEFLNQASENLQLSQTPADPTTVPNGLMPALMQYALANFFKSRYAQYAAKYSSSGGQAGQSIDVVGKGYLMAAEKAENLAKSKRDEFYSRQGQSKSAAYAGTTTQGSQIASHIDPITPQR